MPSAPANSGSSCSNQVAEGVFANARVRVTTVGAILLALLFVPAQLLPPHRLAEVVQSTIGVSWKTSYLAGAVGLHVRRSRGCDETRLQKQRRPEMFTNWQG